MKNKLREIIITRIMAGESKPAIAKALNINRSTVHRAWKAYKERGTTDYQSPPGKPKTVRNENLINTVKAKIEENNEVSVRGLARELNVARTTMERIVKQDLGLKTLSTVPCQQLTFKQREGREAKGKVMLNRLKRDDINKIRVFSDEKDFHVDKYVNRRNKRILAKSSKAVSPSKRYVGRSKFPKKAMMFGYVGSDGTAFPPVWVKGTMDAAQYKSILSRKVFPTLDKTYGVGNYIWTQDGASSHTARSVLSYLERRLGSKGFWSKGIWPANSYNLNPLDYSIWNHVEERACNVTHNSVDSLKASVEKEWAAMNRQYVKDCCKGFRRRLEAMVEAEGGVFEKE